MQRIALAFCVRYAPILETPCEMGELVTMGKSKTGVISVRVPPKIKAALQRAAVKERRSQANMIEVMVLEYCKAIGVEADGESKPVSSAAKPEGTQ